MRRIKAERIRQGLSIAKLARQADMHPATVGQVESGYIGRPYPTQLAKLADALGWPKERSAELLEEVPGDGE